MVSWYLCLKSFHLGCNGLLINSITIYIGATDEEIKKYATDYNQADEWS